MIGSVNPVVVVIVIVVWCRTGRRCECCLGGWRGHRSGIRSRFRKRGHRQGLALAKASAGQIGNPLGVGTALLDEGARGPRVRSAKEIKGLGSHQVNANVVVSARFETWNGEDHPIGCSGHYTEAGLAAGLYPTDPEVAQGSAGEGYLYVDFAGSGFRQGERSWLHGQRRPVGNRVDPEFAALAPVFVGRSYCANGLRLRVGTVDMTQGVGFENKFAVLDRGRVVIVGTGIITGVQAEGDVGDALGQEVRQYNLCRAAVSRKHPGGGAGVEIGGRVSAVCRDYGGTGIPSVL